MWIFCIEQGFRITTNWFAKSRNTTPRTWLNLKDSYLYNIGQSVFKFAYCDKLAKMDELTKRLNNKNFDGYVTDL